MVLVVLNQQQGVLEEKLKSNKILMELNKEELTKQNNQIKLEKCRKELIKMVKEWEKEGVTLDAQIVPIPNGLIAQPVFRIIEKDGGEKQK